MSLMSAKDAYSKSAVPRIDREIKTHRDLTEQAIKKAIKNERTTANLNFILCIAIKQELTQLGYEVTTHKGNQSTHIDFSNPK